MLQTTGLGQAEGKDRGIPGWGKIVSQVKGRHMQGRYEKQAEHRLEFPLGRKPWLEYRTSRITFTHFWPKNIQIIEVSIGVCVHMHLNMSAGSAAARPGVHFMGRIEIHMMWRKFNSLKTTAPWVLQKFRWQSDPATQLLDSGFCCQWFGFSPNLAASLREIMNEGRRCHFLLHRTQLSML